MSGKAGWLIGGVVAIVLAAGLTWSLRSQAEARAELERTREQTAAQLESFAERVERAEQRAVDAEQRAREATDQAERAASEAVAAEERAQWAEEESKIAKQMRDTALQARSRAQQLAQEERQRAEKALAEATKAYQASTAARRDAALARSETEELRARQEAELDRLESTLGEIAETRRTALGVVMNLGRGVEFDLDRAELRPENRELLSRIAGVLLTAGDYHIQVYGHTDDQGDADYNQQLSERRAQSVVDYLVNAGIARRIITARGLGESQPLVQGTSEEARQRNRRVEIAVVSYDQEFAATTDDES